MCNSSIRSIINKEGGNTRNLDNRQTDEMGPNNNIDSPESNGTIRTTNFVAPLNMKRRCKRERQQEWSKQLSSMPTTKSTKRIVKRKKRSDMTAKHQNDSKSGGIDALLPSIIGVVILVIAIMAKMGFRGRSTVAGIDLGTTNSVICVQAQEKGGTLPRCHTYFNSLSLCVKNFL